MRLNKHFHRMLVLVFVAAVGAPALATPPKVVTVPWAPEGGVYTNQHTTYDGYNMLLMGVATDDDGDASLATYEWDFGDLNQTGPIATGGTGPVNIEARHVYNGVNNQPFTATLTVCDTNNDCASDTFRVVVQTLTLDIEVNIAIDEGLWNLHKHIQWMPDVNGQPVGRWTYAGYVASATSSVVQAFLVNEHLAGNDPDEDPYNDTVIRGINYMLTTLRRVNTVPNQTCQAFGPFDPDGNGNGYALGVNSGRPIYETGQVMDALAATRTPLATALTGIPEVLGHDYLEIAEDMADYYSYCQDDSGSDQGGWRYSCNYDADNSACQWAAIGYIGVEQAFNVPTPPCVQTQNELWLYNSRGYSGGYGYTGRGDGMATSAGGMCELAMDDVPTTDSRWVNAEKWYCDNWNWVRNSNNIYAYYGLAKAMYGAVSVNPPDDTIWLGEDPLNPCGSPVNWYGDPVTGLARKLVDSQTASGGWNGSYWVSGDLASAWAVVILKGTIVCPVPVPVCDVDPTTTTIDCLVSFDASQSSHPGGGGEGCGSEIVNCIWDFQDGMVVEDPNCELVEHSFGAIGTYDVTLTAVDDAGRSATTSCPVSVEPPPVEPDSNPNGPYELCLNIPGSEVILDGEASLDPDDSPCQPGSGIVSCEWDLDNDGQFDDAMGCTVDATAYFTALGLGIYDIGLKVTDDEGDTNSDFTTVTVSDVCEVPPCIDPDPSGQGYWHRQCLGVPESEGGIDPGREGRGPQSPTEPGFVEMLMPTVSLMLEDLGFYPETTCSGMDANPPSDQCEKALKQYTAMLLNLASGRITPDCGIDPTESPCSSDNVAELVDEIAALIHGGQCNEAKSCAVAVNEGESVIPTMPISSGGSDPVTAAPETEPIGEGQAVTSLGSTTRPAGRASGRAASEAGGARNLMVRDPYTRPDSLRLQHGPILYYLVPPDYVSDDPRVRIESYGGPHVSTGELTRKEAFGPREQSDTEEQPQGEPTSPRRPSRNSSTRGARR
jgi:hypothetical protein